MSCLCSVATLRSRQPDLKAAIVVCEIMRDCRSIVRILGVLGFFVCTCSMSWAEEPLTMDKQELAELLAQAKTYELRLPRANAVARFHETPLLNFTNPERNQERGSVFVWMHDSRPVVIGQLFRFNTQSDRKTKHAFHSLTSSPVVATYQDAVRWSPTMPGVVWKPIAEAPTPGATHAARMLQIRQLARRFRMTLINPKGDKTELRLISRPLLDYEAPTVGTASGALLSFVIATDPEALLLIEAVTEGNRSEFRYGFARMHFQEIVAHDGETEVWRVDYDPSLMVNHPGQPATMHKIYNSFYQSP